MTYGAFELLVLLVTGSRGGRRFPASAGRQLLVLAAGGLVLLAPW